MATSLTLEQRLSDIAVRYKKELLTMPVAVLKDVFKYMTLRTGCQGVQLNGELFVDVQLRPYRTSNGPQGAISITPNEWTVHLGEGYMQFDPHMILSTIYAERTGKKPDAYDISKAVAMEMSRRAGESLRDNLFVAKRNPTGNTTKDLFSGFSVLIDQAISDGKLSTAKENFIDLSSTPIDASNCGDALKEIWRGSNKHLQKMFPNMMMPGSILDFYEDWYQVEHGHAPFNNKIEQAKLAGSRGKCNFAPLDNMEDQDYLIMSVKKNMSIGVDQISDTEKVEILRNGPKLVDFFMKMHFGVGFETFDHRYLKVVKIAKA